MGKQMQQSREVQRSWSIVHTPHLSGMDARFAMTERRDALGVVPGDVAQPPNVVVQQRPRDHGARRVHQDGPPHPVHHRRQVAIQRNRARRHAHCLVWRPAGVSDRGWQDAVCAAAGGADRRGLPLKAQQAHAVCWQSCKVLKRCWRQHKQEGGPLTAGQDAAADAVGDGGDRVDGHLVVELRRRVHLEDVRRHGPLARKLRRQICGLVMCCERETAA